MVLNGGEVMDNNNIRPCELCGDTTSFERHTRDLPHEGEVCTECDRWICDGCVDWYYMSEHDLVDPICKECTKQQ